MLVNVGFVKVKVESEALWGREFRSDVKGEGGRVYW